MKKMESYKIHKTFIVLILFFFVESFIIGQLSFAAPPEGKGNEKAQANSAENNGKAVGKSENPGSPAQSNRSDQAQEKSTPASDRTESSSQGNSDEAKLERQHPHQERDTLDISDRGTSSAKGENGKVHLAQAAISPGNAFGRSADHAIKGLDAAKLHVQDLLDSLDRLKGEKGRSGEKAHGKENAKWDQNPKDTRGQGNMGKVDMRSPYGFDKDSGREKSERGRAIHPEPVLDLSALVSISFQPDDYFVSYYQSLLNHVLTYWDLHVRLFGSSYTNWYVDYIRRMLDYYTVRSRYTVSLAANMDQGIDYTLSLGDVPTTFEGDALLVTLSLISVNSYDTTVWMPPSGGGWPWVQTTVHYDAGQVVETQTQEVVLNDAESFTFSYDPSTYLTGWNSGQFQLAVTVTEPVSGATYTLTYDRQITIFRCPYGIVYDKKTGKPIVGATVTIHNADGSIVALDKASNPNVSNPQTTDATGRYNAKLAIGKKYYLTVKVKGYEEYKSPLFSERWHIVREDVGLVQLPVVAKK